MTVMACPAAFESKGGYVAGLYTLPACTLPSCAAAPSVQVAHGAGSWLNCRSLDLMIWAARHAHLLLRSWLAQRAGGEPQLPEAAALCAGQPSAAAAGCCLTLPPAQTCAHFLDAVRLGYLAAANACHGYHLSPVSHTAAHKLALQGSSGVMCSSSCKVTCLMPTSDCMACISAFLQR